MFHSRRRLATSIRSLSPSENQKCWWPSISACTKSTGKQFSPRHLPHSLSFPRFSDAQRSQGLHRGHFSAPRASVWRLRAGGGGCKTSDMHPRGINFYASIISAHSSASAVAQIHSFPARQWNTATAKSYDSRNKLKASLSARRTDERYELYHVSLPLMHPRFYQLRSNQTTTGLGTHKSISWILPALCFGCKLQPQV